MTAAAAPLLHFKSLLRPEKSLFLELFSLLIRVGKCLKSDCGTAVSGSEIVPRPSKIADFPVKLCQSAFPVSAPNFKERIASSEDVTFA